MTNLYDQDYALWAEEMAQKLTQKSFDDLDLEHLVEEIRDLSKRERDKLLSSIRLIIHHLLKWDCQPQKRSRSWQITIERERNNIEFYLDDSPSLKKYLNQEWLNKVYRNARLNAAQETGLAFPEECPYSIQDVIEKKVDF